MEKIIQIKNLSKYYKKKEVLKSINLDIYKGDKIALIGGNGSGKTTLVETIAKIRQQTSGEIIIPRDKTVGIQFQESEYPIGVSVQALIDFYLNKYVKIDKTEVKKALKIFRLEKLLKKQIFYLSGGQKQRLNIFLAVIHNPDILILDELSTGLDIRIKTDLENYIVEYLKQHPDITLILVTHTMGEVQKLTNRLIVLDWGKISFDDSVVNVIKKHGSIDSFVEKIFIQMYEVEDKKNDN